MTIGAFVGRLGQWVDFDRKWKGLLKRYDAEYFHSKSLMSSRRHFKGWPFHKKAAFMQDAAKIADKHTLYAFTVMLRADEYEQYYRNSARPRKIQLDSMYGLCVRGAIALVVNMTPRLIGRDDLEISFVFEDGHKNAGDAVRIFNQIKGDGPPDLTKYLKSISFGAKAEFPGLQAADANAYRSFQDEQAEPELTDFPESGTLKEAKDNMNRDKRVRGRVPIFRYHLQPDILQEMKDGLFELEALRRAYGERKPKVA
jgi:hypothetical protein